VHGPILWIPWICLCEHAAQIIQLRQLSVNVLLLSTEIESEFPVQVDFFRFRLRSIRLILTSIIVGNLSARTGLPVSV